MSQTTRATQNETVIVTGLTNREFLERHAKPGCIGLCGGATPVDLAIRHAQRRLDEQRRLSYWSHAFLFEGVRVDGQHWIIESDLQFHRKNIQLGVQENRIAKYDDEKMYPHLAVLDFGLNESQVAALLREGLDLVASHERYSLRELVGTLLALHRPELRGQDNLLARERSVYCSAFVQRLFRRTGIDLSPGVTDKNTTPEDISRTSVPHVTYLLQRDIPTGKISMLRAKLKQQVPAQLRRIRQRVKRD